MQIIDSQSFVALKEFFTFAKIQMRITFRLMFCKLFQLQINYFFLLIILLFSSQVIEAQQKIEVPKKSLKATATVGWAIPILDGGRGFHLGINPNYSFSEFFAIEGQLSYAYANINKFIIGDPAKAQAANALIGGRIYILEDDRQFRPYLNLMGGVLYYFEKDKTTLINSSFFSLGLSAGLYMQIQKRLTIGIAGETPAFLVLKAGYNL